MPTRTPSPFVNRRRRHNYYQATIIYRDGREFARTYNDRDKAVAFAKRQKKSPIVKAVRVVEVD